MTDVRKVLPLVAAAALAAAVPSASALTYDRPGVWNGAEIRFDVKTALGVDLGSRWLGGGELTRDKEQSYVGYWEGTADLYEARKVVGGTPATLKVVVEGGTARCVVVSNDDQWTVRSKPLFRYYAKLLRDFGEDDEVGLSRETVLHDVNGTAATSTASLDGPREVDGYRYGYVHYDTTWPGLRHRLEKDDGTSYLITSAQTEAITICRADEAPPVAPETVGVPAGTDLECYNGLGNCAAAVLSK